MKQLFRKQKAAFSDAKSFIPAQLDERHVLDLLPTAVCVCDEAGVITSYNKKAVELLERCPEPGERLQQFFDGIKFLFPDGRTLSGSDVVSLTWVTGNLAKKDMQVTIEREDGFCFVINLNVVPVKDDEGKLVGNIYSFHDISGQVRIKKELDWKTAELHDYVDNAAVGLHCVDGKGVIKWANRAELEMLGYTEEEYIGHHISEFHADPEKISDILKRLGRNETLKCYESDLICRDGSRRTVQISSNVLWEDNKFVHTRCFTIDVTEQKKLYQALRESESRYHKLINGLQAAVYTTDAEGRITLYNKAAVDLWGREPQIGKDLWCGSYKIYNIDGSPMALESCPMAIALKERRPVLGHEIIVVRPDGTLRNVAPCPKPLLDDDGNLIGAVNMLIDITEAKRAEKTLLESERKLRQLTASLEKKVDERTADLIRKNEDLKRSEEKYHKMIEEVEDYAIVLLDPEGIIQNWNKGAEKIKGYREEEIVGRSFKNFYLDEDCTNGLPDMLLNQARQKGKATHEGWRKRKDGSYFWGSIVITALHDDDGNIVGFSKVTRDLTERKTAEDKAKEYTQQLEFQNKELEQFAFAASHDMKEPLRKISFYNSYIVENSFKQLDDKSKEYLGRSILAVKRMSDLIDALLSYSRANSTVEGFEQTDLNEICEEIILSHKDMIEQKEVIIEMKPLPVVFGIPFQFRQLMDNLINNSIKYKHPNRTAVITITSERVKGFELHIPEAEPRRTYHKISVVDNGIGFETQYADKIFEIFQRLNNHSRYKGSGIGLAICKRIVQIHKGFIKANGTENEGARFDVYLPER